MRFEDLKVGSVYTVKNSTIIWEILYLDDEGYLYKYLNSKAYPSYVRKSSDVSPWIEIKPKIKVRIFLYTYGSDKNKIFTYPANADHWVRPKSIEKCREEMKASSAICWVSDIIEVEVDDTRSSS